MTPKKRYLTAAEEGRLRGEIAHAYFILALTKGHSSGALCYCYWASARAACYWAGGLAAWRSGQIDLAGQFSEHSLIYLKLVLVNAVPQLLGTSD